jgi:hypothetical protein
MYSVLESNFESDLDQVMDTFGSQRKNKGDFDPLTRMEGPVHVNYAQMEICRRAYDTNPQIRGAICQIQDSIFGGEISIKESHPVFKGAKYESYVEFINVSVSETLKGLLLDLLVYGFAAIVLMPHPQFGILPCRLDLSTVLVSFRYNSIYKRKWIYKRFRPSGINSLNSDAKVQSNPIITFCVDPPSPLTGNLRSPLQAIMSQVKFNEFQMKCEVLNMGGNVDKRIVISRKSNSKSINDIKNLGEDNVHALDTYEQFIAKQSNPNPKENKSEEITSTVTVNEVIGIPSVKPSTTFLPDDNDVHELQLAKESKTLDSYTKLLGHLILTCFCWPATTTLTQQGRSVAADNGDNIQRLRRTTISKWVTVMSNIFKILYYSAFGTSVFTKILKEIENEEKKQLKEAQMQADGQHTNKEQEEREGNGAQEENKKKVKIENNEKAKEESLDPTVTFTRMTLDIIFHKTLDADTASRLYAQGIMEYDEYVKIAASDGLIPLSRLSKRKLDPPCLEYTPPKNDSKQTKNKKKNKIKNEK